MLLNKKKVTLLPWTFRKGGRACVATAQCRASRPTRRTPRAQLKPTVIVNIADDRLVRSVWQCMGIVNDFRSHMLSEF